MRMMGRQRLLLGLWRAEAGSAAGLHWKMAAALTAALRGDPIEHRNIRTVESSRQGLRRASALPSATCECAITAERLAMAWRLRKLKKRRPCAL